MQPKRAPVCRLVCVDVCACVPLASARGAADRDDGGREEGCSRSRGGGDSGGVAANAADAAAQLSSPPASMGGRRCRVSACAM